MSLRSIALRYCLAVPLIHAGFAVMAAEAERVDFNYQIRPLLSDRCFRCHGPDAGARKAKMRLDLRESALKPLEDGWQVISPGHPEKSELVRRIFATDEDERMPPIALHLPLSETEKALLKRWIAEGAEYQPHWSFNPVKRIEPPKPANAAWVRNPIDAFVLARLEKEKLKPAAEASPETLLRRLALDLTGLPPEIVEIDAFLADTTPNAYARAMERYLDSPHYGERMALDWLDLARYADTYGYQSDVDYDMSPYRDWVIRAFNDNLAYDQFLIWQLAGDLLPNATRDQRLATAFNRLHRQTNEGGSIDEEFRMEYCADRVNTVGTAMLGLTFECARCHDHKFDPISQRDYYSMLAFFNSIDESGLYSHFTRATPSPALLLSTDAQSAKAVQLQRQIAATEQGLAAMRASAAPQFESWLKSGGHIAPPRPIAHFTFDLIVSNTTPDSVSVTNVASLVDEPKAVPGAPVPEKAIAGRTPAPPEVATNLALAFSGDNQVVCNSVPRFKRTDPFSIDLWLQPTEQQDRAIVLHQSRAWTDSGSRGFELVLDHGRPLFALIHFWPGNAIAARAKQALPTNEWSQLTLTYDGSSRAAGLKLFLNGAALETETVRDHLDKDIVHRAEWGDAEADSIRLQLAGRFRDNGFKNGMIDELQVFDVELTAAEVALLAGHGTPDRRASIVEGGAATRSAAFQYYLARDYGPCLSALSKLRQLREQQNMLLNDIPEIMVMEEMSPPRVTHLLQRGAYDAPGDVVERATPQSLPLFPAGLARNRLGLARWMVDRQHPLTARVAVNRVWRLHFGRGLVATQENFGSQGALPSHPELLDWLAGWFMDQGWDVKALHRLIVNSATFRQSSLAGRELVERDPDNSLLARGPKQRLLAEQIRDGALAASGLLSQTIGGPSVKPYQPAGLWEQSGTGKTYAQDHGEKLYRRSLYTFWRRTAPPPNMLTFDAMSREVCTARRETTATPLQALVLLNDPQFIEAARALGERLLKEHPDDLDARIRAAFRALTGRAPDGEEINVLRRLFDEQKSFYIKDTEAATRLLATGESKRDEALPSADSAAMAALVNAVMNVDEFVVKR